MTAEAACTQIADVTRDLIAGNDDAVDGRLPLLVQCSDCGDQVPWQRGMLGVGQWAIDHHHRRRWSARLLQLTPQVPSDVAALAAALAPTFAGAGR